MTWENAGKFWELDHIIALKTVNITNNEILAKVAHYTNLQPLTKEEHRLKTIEDLKKVKQFKEEQACLGSQN